MNETKLRFSRFSCLCAAALLSLVPITAMAQRATQIVRYSVTGVSQGQVSSASSTPTLPPAASAGGFSAPQELPANSVRALLPMLPGTPTSRVGQPVVPVWQASYGITNNESNKKLSVSIDAPMPEGMELNANISAPPGADARGPVDIGTAASDVVTGIGTGNTGSLAADFSVAASNANAGNAVSRKVTFTLISGA